MLVALVTEELACGPGSGGIGGAFYELSILLSRAGHIVTMLYVPSQKNQATLDDIKRHYLTYGVEIQGLAIDQYVWSVEPTENRAYAIFCHLRESEVCYDYIHFHDYKGLGYFCFAAKAQRLAFSKTQLVVQMHGPTRWTLEANDYPFTHEDQLKIDFMEQTSIARADILVSPSRYMLRWLSDTGWSQPSPDKIHVIQNACLELQRNAPPILRPDRRRKADELVLFARHEPRKGIIQFCDALDLLEEELAEKGIQVTFLGPLGLINGEDSLLYLANRAKCWRFSISILPDLDRAGAASYLTSNANSLVIVPSPIENSPYTVLETIVLGKPILTSVDGGAHELLSPTSAKKSTCQISGSNLAHTIRNALKSGLSLPELSISPSDTERLWLKLHAEQKPISTAKRCVDLPKVTAVITHYERPFKLFDAIMSLARQTYRNLEIIVVDDGSPSEGTRVALDRLQPLVDRLGIRLMREPNRYLGAARNCAARETNSDYLLFLDDDDIAFPDMIETLVHSAQASDAEIVAPLNLFMEEERRGDAHPFPDKFRQKVSYVPLGGPLTLAPLQNVFGTAVSLIKRSLYVAINGYTEKTGVGHEDYEFYVRAVQHGARLEICPMPLYLYEVGRPSMISRTSQHRNFKRIVMAVDVTDNADSWNDLVSLNAGRRAAEHSENVQSYLRQISPNSALLHLLGGTSSASMEYASILADFCQTSRAYSFGRALRALATQRQMQEGGVLSVNAAPILPALSPGSISQASKTPVDQHILDALVHLEFGRFPAAGTAFRLSIERERRLTASQRRFLVELAHGPILSPADYAPVLDALALCITPLGADAGLLPIIFRLLIRGGASELARALMKATLDNEKAEYLQVYHDVSVNGRNDPQFGFVHYCNHGKEEGRNGFVKFEMLRLIVEEELKQQVDLVALLDIPLELNQSGDNTGILRLVAA